MDGGSLYDRDFYLWTQQQARAMRRQHELRPNADIDWENLIEEVESLGRSDMRAVRSQLARIIEHLLKLEFSPAEAPRQKWAGSANDGRRELDELLGDSPSLRGRLDALMVEAWTSGRLKAAIGLAEDGLGIDALPTACPYTLDQMTQWGWYPASRYGFVPPRA